MVYVQHSNSTGLPVGFNGNGGYCCEFFRLQEMDVPEEAMLGADLFHLVNGSSIITKMVIQ